MKRKTKNIISFVIIAFLICSIGFTIYEAKNNLTNDTTTSMSEQNNQMGNPPEMPSGDTSSESNGNGQTPPEMPSGESQNSENSDSQTPPEKPDGETTTDSSSDTQSVPEKPEGESNNSTSDTQNAPVKPEGSDSTGESTSDGQTPPVMPSGESQNGGNVDMQMPTDMVSESESTSLTVPYYVAFGVETLLLSLSVVYLIQSNLNKKTIKETYSKKGQIVVIVLTSIVATAGLTCGLGCLTNNVVLDNNTSSNNETSNNGQLGNNVGGSTSSATYSAASEITESTSVSDETYTSSTADENALSVSGDIEVTADGIEVTKTGDSDGGDSTSFYGINSAVIAKDGATLNISNATITTDATGANGVFSYGGSATTNNSSSDGTTVNISDSTITTSKDNSGGIMTTGGGITNASNLTVTTAGTSSAAIRTDRGGGTVTVDGGTYKTTGQGSPTIYSTAEILVKNATLIATASEGVVIEGKNSVTLENVDLTDTNNKLNGQSTTYKNIFLYQSMSGDADDGVSEFTAKDSTITTNKGDTFYITNTTATITLTNNTIVNNDEDGNFLRAQADSWGTTGSNGGLVTLVMNNQKASGNIIIDSVSTLDMTLTKSSYTGTINGDNTAKSITLKLDKNSKIKLTGDSYVTSLDDADSTYSNIDFNGYTLYVNGEAIN